MGASRRRGSGTIRPFLPMLHRVVTVTRFKPMSAGTSSSTSLGRSPCRRGTFDDSCLPISCFGESENSRKQTPLDILATAAITSTVLAKSKIRESKAARSATHNPSSATSPLRRSLLIATRRTSTNSIVVSNGNPSSLKLSASSLFDRGSLSGVW